MKKFILMAVCVLSALTVSAQMRPTLSLEVGVGASTWMGDKPSGTNGIFNPRIGVAADIPLTEWFSFQPGLSWVSKGAKVETTSSDLKVNQNYFQVPLLMAFHMPATDMFDVVLTAGPYVACGINGKTETESGGITTSWSTFKNVSGTPLSGLRRFDAGIEIGVGLDFQHWVVGVDADFGLCKIVENGPRNFDIFVSAGIKF